MVACDGKDGGRVRILGWLWHLDSMVMTVRTQALETGVDWIVRPIAKSQRMEARAWV